MSLRAWLILVLLLVNGTVLGVMAFWVAGDEAQVQAAQRQRIAALEKVVRDRFPELFQSIERGELGELLDWPLWEQFEDVMLMDHSVVRIASAAQEQVVPKGLFLNPIGSRHRPPDFPTQEIAQAIDQAVQALEGVPVAAGLAVPLVTADRGIWGGVYVRTPETRRLQVMPAYVRVLLAAVIATILGAAAIYWLVGKGVIRPIEQLAAASSRFSSGGEVALPHGRGAAEVRDLTSTIDAMLDEIAGFHRSLEAEVERASARATEAERHAARQDRLASIGTLAAGVAHEINSPLGGLAAALETIEKEVRSDRGRRYTGLMQDGLARITDLVQRLLRLAPRADSPKADAEIAPVVTDLQAFLASRLVGRSLHVVLPPDLPPVAADAPDLFALLLNLLNNALDALDGSPDRPQELGLEVLAEEEHLRIQVWDAGKGPDPELLDRLFEPFVTSKEVGAGTGLGLALVYSAAQRMGGEVSANLREGGGLVVELNLPRAG